MKKGLIKIYNSLYCESYELVSEIFKYFRPIHIEFRHWENDVWYIYGVCEQFDEAEDFKDIPEYEVEISRDELSNISCRFHRVI